MPLRSGAGEEVASPFVEIGHAPQATGPEACEVTAHTGDRLPGADGADTVDQFFDVTPVPIACLGDGCAAPEERGDASAGAFTHRLPDGGWRGSAR